MWWVSDYQDLVEYSQITAEGEVGMGSSCSSTRKFFEKAFREHDGVTAALDCLACREHCGKMEGRQWITVKINLADVLESG